MHTDVLPRTRGLLAGFTNSADLGGLALPDGGTTAHRRLVRSDVPAHLSDAQHQAAVAFGFTAVLDLRSGAETRATPHPLADQPGYQALPLIDPAAEARRDAAAEPTVGEVYAASLTRNAVPIAAVLTALAQARPGPVMVCCAAGRDRTGMIAALLLDLAGVDRAVIAADHAAPEGTCPAPRSTAPRAAPAVIDPSRSAFGMRTADSSTGPLPARRGAADITVMLTHLSAVHGATAGYLRRLGLPPGHIAALRARLHP